MKTDDADKEREKGGREMGERKKEKQDEKRRRRGKGKRKKIGLNIKIMFYFDIFKPSLWHSNERNITTQEEPEKIYERSPPFPPFHVLFSLFTTCFFKT
jgi:hypothetical protein